MSVWSVKFVQAADKDLEIARSHPSISTDYEAMAEIKALEQMRKKKGKKSATAKYSGIFPAANGK